MSNVKNYSLVVPRVITANVNSRLTSTRTSSSVGFVIIEVGTFGALCAGLGCLHNFKNGTHFQAG